MLAAHRFFPWLHSVMGLCGMLLIATPAAAQMEFAFQYGSLVNPFSAAKANTRILTFQHASGWQFGDSFFFIDFLDDNKVDGFNDVEFYGEWYPTLSMSKVRGTALAGGPIADISLIMGLNFDADADVLKYLPGGRLSWSVPGFVFLNTDFTAVVDASNGIEQGGAPTTSSGFMFDVSWLYPISLGSQSFVFTGHAEYLSSVENELGDEVKWWILAQPQLTWDLGAALGSAGHLMVGVEYQIWRNKLGTDNHDNIPQLLVVWRL